MGRDPPAQCSGGPKSDDDCKCKVLGSILVTSVICGNNSLIICALTHLFGELPLTFLLEVTC